MYHKSGESKYVSVLAFLFLLLFFPGRITVSGATAKEAAADRAAAEKTAAEGVAAEAAAIEGTDAEAAAAEGLSAEEASGRDAEKDEGVCIYVMTDPHYLSPELTDGGASFLKTVQNGDSKLPQYSDLYMSAFTDAVLDAEPDLVIHGPAMKESAPTADRSKKPASLFS